MSLSHTLEHFLEDHGAHYTLEHHAPSISSIGTARAALIDEDSLAKSVLLEDDRGHVLAVLPASRRLELSRVRRALGRSLQLAREQDMPLLFPDCLPGALPPLGTAYGLQTVVDRSLEDRDVVFFEAGDHETLVCVEGQLFLDLLSDASLGEIASESESLLAARIARERLYGALMRVNNAVGAPVGNGLKWRHRVLRELRRLRAALRYHVVETEAPEGLLAEIVEQAPRLAREVERLRAEHETLAEGCDQMLLRAEGDDSPALIRKQTMALLGRFAAHRHRGADLVYEAFDVDLGGG